MSKKRIAVIPGSFDPITKGHVSLVERALMEYDEIYLAVMINPSKQYLFTLEQRTAIAIAALRSYERVKVISSEGMLWELAEKLGACAIVKGYRNQTDYEYELKMAVFNAEHNPDAPTVLYRSDESLVDVSSTVVRERLHKGLTLEPYLPPETIPLIECYFSEKQ